MLKNEAVHQFPGAASGAGEALLGAAGAVPHPNACRVYAGRVWGKVKKVIPVEDPRHPWPVLPDWVSDPVQPSATLATGPRPLKEGRYEVESSLHFSNSGGVYKGIDKHTGMQVVIKEARPLVARTNSGADAVTALRKEHRILSGLEATVIAPRVIDLFEQWEHLFLVEEFVGGMTLRSHASAHAICRIVERDVVAIREFYTEFRGVFLSLAEALAVLHQHGIVFRDLSPSNVIVLPNGGVRLVDFEAACEIGVDSADSVFTPGFAGTDHFAHQFARFENDLFSLGALMCCYLLPVHAMVGLDPCALRRFATAVSSDYGLPQRFVSTVIGLTEPEASQRPDLAAVMSDLDAEPEILPARISVRQEFDNRTFTQLLADIVTSVIRTATPDRDDRLFPADPKVFVTNPLGVAYGACGVAYAINRITGALPPGIRAWLLRHEVECGKYPPGLYSGMAGIAWTYLELGLHDVAERIMLDSHNHPLLFDSADMFYGAAGWGMANLRFFLALGRQVYLDGAVRAGRYLLEHRLEEGDSCFWPTSEEQWVGLGHGPSGVALFLLYLYLATGEQEFLGVGEKGLQSDMRQAVSVPGALSWPTHRGQGASKVPYWRYGSAGVGSALIRFRRVWRDDRFGEIVRGIFSDTARKYAIFPGRFFGLAGMGDFLLDLEVFEDETDKYLNAARVVAAGIALFRIDGGGFGVGFPGFNLWKLSYDYGSGGAGIALFLHRLVTGCGPDFMLDELFQRAKLISGDAGERPRLLRSIAPRRSECLRAQ